MKASYLLLAVCLVSISVYAGEKEPSRASKKAARQDTIHVIGHAHMDMNWEWTTSETMKMCQDNLRQAVAFMDEYPDYYMLQSQAAIYNFVEKADPQLFELVKKYVKEGRLELAGGEWTEGDTNLSSGEAITRSFLLGQRYFQQHFGRMAKIGWLPDNFGHISQLPQILKLAGCDYFYFHRCKPYLGAFWWVAPDSSKVFCYANDTYNGDITDELKKDIDRYGNGKHRILQITGEGDHGGGPSRANIEKVHQLNQTPGHPAIMFTPAERFFAQMSRESGLPTQRDEMQFIFEGCYTTVADTKEGNRNSESSLYASEFLNTLNWLNGEAYPADQLRELWKTVTFNQFHDILPGSAINEANKEAHARYMDVLWKSNELRSIAFRKITDEIKFKNGMGQPVVAFNLQPQTHNAIVEVDVYSHEKPVSVNPVHWGDYYGGKNIQPVDAGQGKVPTVLVRDGAGKTYPAQIVWSKKTPPGYTSKVRFIVENLPAGGYKTFYVDMSKPGETNELIPFADNTFETDFFRVRFNMQTGGITSLYDKRTRTECVREGEELNKLRIYTEDKQGRMKAWALNKIVNEEDVTNVESVKVVENGPVRACVETVKTWGKSRFIERAIIYRSYPRIEYEMEVHWLETGSNLKDSPMLRALFPLAIKEPRFYCQTPFDVVERPANGKIYGKEPPLYLTGQTNIYGIQPETNDGQEVPAQKWVDLTDGQTGVALLNKSKYGHSYHKGDLRLTLMRSGGDPDIYPNLGKFNIHYALYPHAGDWKNNVMAEGEDFNIPVFAAEPPSLAIGKNHATRSEEDSFISVYPQNVVMTGMKQSEEGEELVLRVYETEGKSTTATIKIPVVANGTARRLNILELPVAGTESLAVNNGALQLSLKPHEIVTIGIKVSR
ncbi:MAG: glycosyl hydrolase-related protein [Tannerella sp.]|jgi:alpha-mannosidase|nr:glycosyl hydrolase-related protein [Tannerella sp.]